MRVLALTAIVLLAWPVAAQDKLGSDSFSSIKSLTVVSARHEVVVRDSGYFEGTHALMNYVSFEGDGWRLEASCEEELYWNQCFLLSPGQKYDVKINGYEISISEPLPPKKPGKKPRVQHITYYVYDATPVAARPSVPKVSAKSSQ